MEYNFCRKCGTKLTQINEVKYSCQSGHEIYFNPKPAAGLFLISPVGKLLLSIRKVEPHKGAIDSFGGFIDANENAEQALTRETKEELQLNPEDYSTPEYLGSATADYFFDGETCKIITSLYYAQLKEGAKPIASDDVAEIKVCDISEIDIDNVVQNDVRFGLQELKKRLQQ